MEKSSPTATGQHAFAWTFDKRYTSPPWSWSFRCLKTIIQEWELGTMVTEFKKRLYALFIDILIY